MTVWIKGSEDALKVAASNTKPKYFFTADDALELLGGIPDSQEVDRLIHHYPSYKKPVRKQLLNDILNAEPPYQMALNKQKVTGDIPFDKRGTGGQVKWATKKIRRFARRVAYLRLRLDVGMTQIQANQHLMKYYDIDPIKTDATKANIQKVISDDTMSVVLD